MHCALPALGGHGLGGQAAASRTTGCAVAAEPRHASNGAPRKDRAPSCRARGGRTRWLARPAWRHPHGANSLAGSEKERVSLLSLVTCSGAESQSRQRERWVARDGGRVLTPGGGGLRRTGTLGGRHPKGFAPGQGAQGQADSDIQGQGSPQPRRRRRAGGPSVFQRCAHRVL